MKNKSEIIDRLGEVLENLEKIKDYNSKRSFYNGLIKALEWVIEDEI